MHPSASKCALNIQLVSWEFSFQSNWQVGTVRHGYAKVVYIGLLVGIGKEKCSSFNHQRESFWYQTVSGWQWSWYSQNLHTHSQSAISLLMLNRDISSTPSPFYRQAQNSHATSPFCNRIGWSWLARPMQFLSRNIARRWHR